MTNQIKNKPFITKKSKTHQVTYLGNGVYEIISGESGETYRVRMTERGATCTCEWAKYRKWFIPESGCSHSIAAFRYSFDQRDRYTSMWVSQEDAERQHRSQIDIGDGVIVTTRPKQKKAEAQILEELGF